MANIKIKKATKMSEKTQTNVIDITNCLDNCVETGGMLFPVDPGEMSDVIDFGLEEIAIIPPST